MAIDNDTLNAAFDVLRQAQQSGDFSNAQVAIDTILKAREEQAQTAVDAPTQEIPSPNEANPTQGQFFNEGTEAAPNEPVLEKPAQEPSQADLDYQAYLADEEAKAAAQGETGVTEIDDSERTVAEAAGVNMDEAPAEEPVNTREGPEGELSVAEQDALAEKEAAERAATEAEYAEAQQRAATEAEYAAAQDAAAKEANDKGAQGAYAVDGVNTVDGSSVTEDKPSQAAGAYVANGINTVTGEQVPEASQPSQPVAINPFGGGEQSVDKQAVLMQKMHSTMVDASNNPNDPEKLAAFNAAYKEAWNEFKTSRDKDEAMSADESKDFRVAYEKANGPGSGQQAVDMYGKLVNKSYVEVADAADKGQGIQENVDKYRGALDQNNDGKLDVGKEEKLMAALKNEGLSDVAATEKMDAIKAALAGFNKPEIAGGQQADTVAVQSAPGKGAGASVPTPGS